MLPHNLLAWTKQSLRQYNLRAGQKLGQHFLVDSEALQDIINAAELNSTDKVLEIGGGLGVLTLALLETGAQVTTVELDKKLITGLKKLSLVNNLQVIASDVLRLSDHKIIELLKLQPAEQFSIVSNLPYEISGVFLRKFLESKLPIKQLIILLQKEVAQRLQAQAGDMSLLGLLAQATSEVKLVRLVKSDSFYPPPQVESALVKIIPKTDQAKLAWWGKADWSWLWRVARIGFAAKRKTLANNLSSALPLSTKEAQELLTKLNLNPLARAQELSAEKWVALAQALFKHQG